MKKDFKKLFFRVFFVAILLSLTFSVKALTIKETTNPNDSYDNLVDGTIVIGITKFEPGVVITALRASQASYNDAMFKVYTGDYFNLESAKIYYLLMGKWYNIDINNKVTLVVDEEIKTKLNSNDIYYVNNVEKMLKNPYSIELEDGYNLEFSTGISAKDDKIVYENGNINVPATVGRFAVFARNIETQVQTHLTDFAKISSNGTEFLNLFGTIEGDKTLISPEATYEQKLITLNIGGTLNWYEENIVKDGYLAGNYAAVKIMAPEFYDEEDLEYVTVVVDGVSRYWNDTPFEKNGTTFTYYPRFDNETKSHEILIFWKDTVRHQLFEIELSETAILLEP